MCDREAELVVGLRAGALGVELRTHLTDCSACQQTERAAALLLAYAEAIAAAAVPPPAAGVWRRAQQRRQEAALRRASKAMLAMWTGGAVYVLGIVTWGLRTLWQMQPEQARRAMLPLASGAVPFGVGAATVLLLCGASALVIVGRRQQPLLLR